MRKRAKKEESKEIAVVEEEKAVTTEMVSKYLQTFGVGKGLNQNEMEAFVMQAVHHQLDPLKREIHVVVYTDQETKERTLSIMTGYEVYLRRAEKSGLLEWWDCEIKNEDDFTKMKAVLTVKRRDRQEAWTWTVWYNEANTGMALWKKMPRLMLRKCAIAQGFRLYFPEVLGGAPYIQEEIGVPEKEIPYERPPRASDEAITVNFSQVKDASDEADGTEEDGGGFVLENENVDEAESDFARATFSDLVKLINKVVPQAERPKVMAGGREFIDDPEGMGRYVNQIKEKYGE